MKRNFILDEEINLLGSNDLLNTRVYADNLEKAIVNAPKGKSFTIGLFGEWGSGKSSIIKTVRERLEKPKNNKIKFVLYDAWKYSNDSFRRMFLLELQNALNFERDTLMAPFYSNKSEEAQVKLKANTPKLVIMVLVLFILVIIVNIADLSGEWKLGLSTFIPLIGLLITILYKLFDELKITIQKPYLFAPEQFEDCFKEMIEKSLKQYNWAEKSLCYVNGDNSVKGIERLIIVIDNIDRCHKEMAYELLTNVKNFLGSSHNIIFIIPVDDSALRKHIVSNVRNNGNGKCDKEAEEFLRKFFNATIRIKPYHTEEMFDFAEKINKKHTLNFSPTTIDIVSKEYARNPRRIIQFFNNLSLELAAFSESFATQFEDIICKLLIIREEYPDFYYKLSLDSSLLHTGAIEDIKPFFVSYPELKGFLESTRLITQSISMADLEKILSNSNVFSGISQELLKSINSLNIDEISKFIENDKSKRSTLIKYLIDQLQKGISRKTFDTEVIPKFNLITLINEKHHLEKDENQRILEAINDHLPLIFEKSEIVNTIRFCKSSFDQNLTTITDFSIDWITDGIVNRTADGIVNAPGIEERINEAFESFVKLVDDSSLLSKLKESFKVYYFRKIETYSCQDIPEEQLKILADEEFLTDLVDHIFQLHDEDYYYNDFDFFAKTIKLPKDIVIKFLKKLNELHSNFNYKTIDEIDSAINFFNSWLGRIDYDLSKDLNEISDLIVKITTDRKIANPSSPTRRELDININYIDEILNNEDNVENIAVFFKHIYRLSIGTINITTFLNRLIIVDANRPIVNNQLVELLNQAISLNSLTQFVISDPTYTDQSFKLLKNSFIQKNKEEFVVTDEQLSNKLQEILELIFEEIIPSTELLNFIEDLISEERIKKSLQNLLSKESKRNIRKLSLKLKTLAIDVILNEDLKQFADNPEFLKAVAATGEPKHIQRLVRILKTKLPDESQVEESIEIILEMRSVNSSDAAKLINELNDYKTEENPNEKVIEAIQYLQKLGGLNESSKYKKKK